MQQEVACNALKEVESVQMSFFLPRRDARGRFNIFPRTLNQCTDHMALYARRNWSKQEYIYTPAPFQGVSQTVAGR